MTRTDAAPGGGESDWLDEHVELFAVAALTPAERARVESELAALAPSERAVYETRIADIHAAMAGFASTFALHPPPELRSRVLSHVFDGPARAAGTDEDADPAEISAGENVTAEAAAADAEAAVGHGHPAATSGAASAPRSGESAPDRYLPHPQRPSRHHSGQHHSGQHRSGASARRPMRATSILAAAAVTVAVALGAGVLIGRTTAPDTSTSSTALSDSQQQVLGVLTAADATVTVEPLADDRGTIAVITSQTADQAVAILRDLREPISPDQAFQLWLVGGAEQPVSAGVIPGDDTEPVVVDELAGSSVLAVTIEPAGGSAQPTTPILAQVEL
ncbi:anti-sigma factor [Gordonia sp. zg691]|uniref:Regulator of SigK n=1 Tax=Gordonia jinghuaiqii TaxID=2758710 RepID=A0A7D7R623_9ACTN|nr:anti-sigma factor [Gordonia jinghuaiqii]MCR5979495.1 anti-sigma factor [Gordonia jinghuaiqii]QMT03992.1 anti-sigma factor [Gordonia jinghuaiqii]